jgi:unsaturated rhamnogalacturonyl hydrolase
MRGIAQWAGLALAALLAGSGGGAVPAAPRLGEPARPLESRPWSQRVADSVMRRTPDPLLLDVAAEPRWEYTQGLLLRAILEVWQRTGDQRYWSYAKTYYDGMIDASGQIRGGYRLDEYNIDRINPGKPLFLLYSRTGDEKYRKAIELLRRQLREQPRTREGGFWHKQRYPHQMWLDGLYMGAPFLAQYAAAFGEPAAFDDVATQFVLMERQARDETTGLLHHGWDESRQQRWADPRTGRSPAFWGRAMGWYAMGLVDALDFVPAGHPGRAPLLAILERLAGAIARVQDPERGVFHQVLDQPSRQGNYREASVSAMFSYALLKAARLGYLDVGHGERGRRAYQGMLREFVSEEADGLVSIRRACQVAGLGSDPQRQRYRDGSFDYYTQEPTRNDDPKAVGPFILASLEMEGNP